MLERVATPLEGLDEREAALRLQRDGPNVFARPARRTPGRIALEVAREPMFQLLAAAVAVYLLLGDVGEALLLLAFVGVTAAITVVQAARSERVLDALRELARPRATVLREGVRRQVPSGEVVCGDVVVLADGDRVPADAALLVAHDLLADESVLTGESVPVAKRAGRDPGDPGEAGPAAADDGEQQVYAGTMIAGGQGLARVVAVGARTQLGGIAESLAAIEEPPTPLQRQTRRLVRLFALLGLALSAALVLLYGLLRGQWLEGLLAGITLAMAMLPEEFVLILGVFAAMGAWRMSRAQVLTRRPAALEAVGAATVLCADKTGTLTENRMAVAELAAVPPQPCAWRREQSRLPEACQALLEAALLASEREPADPMERALHELAARELPAARRHEQALLLHEYPLGADLLAMTHVWRLPGRDVPVVAVKGALEAVLALCRLEGEAAGAATAQAQRMAERGLRVLAVASGEYLESHGIGWPATPHAFELRFVGLVGLEDPLRDGVAEAVRECQAAGLRVLMITGDHAVTARAIARQAGLRTDAPPVLGEALAVLDEAALADAVARSTVFARVRPQHKLRIVQALKARGEVVAMTGDGVNDAPSLRAAHVGIAMGRRGTDVAREAAALVLLDDDFATIARAVRLGRRVHDNLRKAMAFVLAVHVPIAGLALLPLLLGWPVLLTPIHVVVLELIIDPVCSIAFEAEGEEPDLMRRPPRDPDAPLFSAGLVGASLARGGAALGAVAALYLGLLQAAVAPALARGSAFAALLACNVVLILASRTLAGRPLAGARRPNPLLARMLLAVAALLGAALYLPPLARLFGFQALPPALLALALGTGLALAAVLEAASRLLAARPSPGAA